MPIFLDIEASSFSPDSYPIEIAWGEDEADVEVHLINPDFVSTWDDWNVDSEKIHGISREDLRDNGEDPKDVARKVTSSLENRVVYTDNPEYDGMWLYNLYQGTSISPPDIDIRNVDELFMSHLNTLAAPRLELLKRFVLAKTDSRAGYRQHRADNDVKYLISLWKKIQSF